MIKFENVSKVYPPEVKAVTDFNLTINQGEIMALVGPSGCGKTTVLKMINRLVEVSGGSILVDGREISNWDPIDLRRGIGYVIQQVGLFPHLNIMDNIAYVLKITGHPRDEMKRKAAQLLDLVGLEPELLYRYPGALSGGQQQRVGFARALAANPAIILMDEPFGSLDRITRNQLQDELLALHQKLGKTIIFVTHDLQEAFKLGHRTAIMAGGRLIQVGTVRELVNSCGNEFVQNFLGTEGFAHLLDTIPIREAIYREYPVCIEGQLCPAESLELAVELAMESLPVVDELGIYQGVVSVHQAGGPDWRVEPGQGFSINQSLNQALMDMFREGRTWLPVINPAGYLEGVVLFRRAFDLLSGKRGLC